MRTLGIALLILVPPYLEYALLRYALHTFLELKIGWSGLVDYDLFLPVIGGFVLLFFCLIKETALTPKLSLSYLASNAIFFLLVLFYGYGIQNHAQSYSFSQLIPFWWLVLSTFFTGFCLFVPPSFYILNKNRLAIIPSVLITFSIVLQNHLFKPLFHFFGPSLASSTCHLLKPFLREAVSCSYSPTTQFALLLHSDFAIKIGHGCGGGDGIILFLSVFSLFYIFNKNLYSKPVWLLHALSGVIYMYLINLLRISLLFISGVYLSKGWGRSFSTELVSNFFHIHIGWILYSVAIALFLYLLKFVSVPLFSTKLVKQSSTLILFVFLSLFYSIDARAEATCGEACATSSECSVSVNCRVCDGVCIGCADLADSTSCGDVSMGASTMCAWSGSACVDAPGVPELPKAFWLFIIPVFLAIVVWKL